MHPWYDIVLRFALTAGETSTCHRWNIFDVSRRDINFHDDASSIRWTLYKRGHLISSECFFLKSSILFNWQTNGPREENSLCYFFMDSFYKKKKKKEIIQKCKIASLCRIWFWKKTYEVLLPGENSNLQQTTMFCNNFRYRTCC